MYKVSIGELVQVDWDDANADYGWQDPKQVKVQAYPVASFGIVVAYNEECICLTESVTYKDKSRTTPKLDGIGSTLNIPWVNVVNVFKTGWHV